MVFISGRSWILDFWYWDSEHCGLEIQEYSVLKDTSGPQGVTKDDTFIGERIMKGWANNQKFTDTIISNLSPTKLIN